MSLLQWHAWEPLEVAWFEVTCDHPGTLEDCLGHLMPCIQRNLQDIHQGFHFHCNLGWGKDSHVSGLEIEREFQKDWMEGHRLVNMEVLIVTANYLQSISIYGRILKTTAAKCPKNDLIDRKEPDHWTWCRALGILAGKNKITILVSSSMLMCFKWKLAETITNTTTQQHINVMFLDRSRRSRNCPVAERSFFAIMDRSCECNWSTGWPCVDHPPGWSRGGWTLHVLKKVCLEKNQMQMNINSLCSTLMNA